MKCVNVIFMCFIGAITFIHEAPDAKDADHYLLLKNERDFLLHVKSGDNISIACNNNDHYRVGVNIKGSTGALLGPRYRLVTKSEPPINFGEPIITSLQCDSISAPLNLKIEKGTKDEINQ